MTPNDVVGPHLVTKLTIVVNSVRGLEFTSISIAIYGTKMLWKIGRIGIGIGL